MPYSVQCPNCSDTKIHDKKLTGLHKCPSCRVVYLPKPSLQSKDNKRGEPEKTSKSLLNKMISNHSVKSNPTKGPVKATTDKKFILEFSDDDDEDDVSVDLSSLKLSKSLYQIKVDNENAKKILRRPTRAELDFELSDVESEDDTKDKVPFRRPTTIKTSVDLELSDVESVDIRNDKTLLRRPKATTTTETKTRVDFELSDGESVDVRNDTRFSGEKKKTASSTTTRQKTAKESSSSSESDEELSFRPKITTTRPRRAKKSVSVSLDSDIEKELNFKTSGKKRALEPSDDEYVGYDNYDDDEYEDEFERDFFTEQQKERPGSDHEEFLSSTYSNEEDTIGGKKVVRLNFKNDPLFTRRMDEASDDDQEENSHQNKETSPSEDPLFSDMDDDMDEGLLEPPKPKRRVPRKPKAVVEPGGVLQTTVFRSGMEKDKTIKDSRLPNPDKPKRSNRFVRRFGAKPGNRFNPFILFNKEYRNQIKEANPHLNYLEITQLVGKTFKELGPEEKETFMRNVRKKAEAAVANAPPKPTPFPKRPPNAFLLFKSINKHKIKESDEPTNNVNAFITKLWKNTPEDEKDIYREDAKTLMREFIEKNPTLYAEMSASVKAKGRSTRRSKLRKTTTQSGE